MGAGSRGAFGWPGAFGTWWQADPEEDMIILYLVQNSVPSAPNSPSGQRMEVSERVRTSHSTTTETPLPLPPSALTPERQEGAAARSEQDRAGAACAAASMSSPVPAVLAARSRSNSSTRCRPLARRSHDRDRAAVDHGEGAPHRPAQRIGPNTYSAGAIRWVSYA